MSNKIIAIIITIVCIGFVGGFIYLVTLYPGKILLAIIIASLGCSVWGFYLRVLDAVSKKMSNRR